MNVFAISYFVILSIIVLISLAFLVRTSMLIVRPNKEAQKAETTRLLWYANFGYGGIALVLLLAFMVRVLLYFLRFFNH